MTISGLKKKRITPHLSKIGDPFDGSAAFVACMEDVSNL